MLASADGRKLVEARQKEKREKLDSVNGIIYFVVIMSIMYGNNTLISVLFKLFGLEV